jgi:GT2 family glycosyltransferase
VEHRAGAVEVAPVTAELSVLIVNYNTWCECAAAIDSLRAHPPTRADGTPMPYECIVVDNRSPNRDPAEIRMVEAALDRLRGEQGDAAAGRLILHTENAGYSKGVNLAFTHSRGRWILVSNPDLEFTAGLIPALQRHLERDPRAGCTVPKGFWDDARTVRLPPNTLPTLGDLLWTTLGEFWPAVSRRYSRRLLRSCMRVWLAERPLPLPMMSGCLFLIERSFFESVGGMDERFPLYYEDADLSVRIRKAGRLVVQVPDAKLVHFVNRSGRSDLATMWQRYHQSRRLYYRKWYGRPGLWLLEACEWLLRTDRLRRLRHPAPHGPMIDLGASSEKPRVDLPRPCERFLLLMSLDPRFYLSGAWFGSGAGWTPTDALFSRFQVATYFYRAFDLTGGRMQQLGTWRHSLSSAPTPETAGAGG